MEGEGEEGCGVAAGSQSGDSDGANVKITEDIKTDIEVTSRSLTRPGWSGKEAGVDGYLWGEDVPSS